MKTKEMDMLNGSLAGKLILFSIPLVFSSILQQLFNNGRISSVVYLHHVKKAEKDFANRGMN